MTLYIVITAVGEAGTMMMGVLKRLSERGDRWGGGGRGKGGGGKKRKMGEESGRERWGRGGERREVGERKLEGEMEGEKSSEGRWELGDNSY